MGTELRRADGAALDRAAGLIRAGRLVAFPTETVYGLGAAATDPSAVARVYAAKGRPADNPLIVHVEGPGGALALGRMDRRALDLAERFWPGPLTLVLKRRDGAGTVAVRCPDHPVALDLIRLAGRPVAAPSANSSGRPSPTAASHVVDDLDGRVDLVLDGGPTGWGIESTVLDASGERLRVLRPGGVTRRDLASAGFPAEAWADGGDVPMSPGTRYRHYAPRVPVAVVEGAPEDVRETFGRWARAARSAGLRPAAVVLGEGVEGVSLVRSFPSVEAMARGLFGTLRELEGVADVLLVEAPAEEGVGEAVRNRLEKASGGRIGTPGGDLPEVLRRG